MANQVLGQVLGSVFAHAMRGRARSGPFGAGPAGAAAGGAAEETDEVIGGEELARVATELGVPEREVALGFAEIVPQLVDQLSPGGQVPPEADDALDAGRSELEKELQHLTGGAPV